MMTVDRLAELARQINLPNVYQYFNIDGVEPDIPFHIRIFLRSKRASALGKAIHNQHTLVMALNTPGTARLDRQEILLEPGQALLIFPGQLHDYADRLDADVLWLFFGFRLRDNSAYFPLLNSPLEVTDQIAQDAETIMSQYYGALAGRAALAGLEAQIALRLKLILEQLLQIRSAQIMALGDDDGVTAAMAFPLVQKTCAYVSDHLSEAISLDQVAEALHVSPGHLRNEFSRRAGCSLGRYIRYMKMHNACILMNTTTMTLTEIAEACGYGSIYAFSRAFKHDKGISPSEYRQLHETQTGS